MPPLRLQRYLSLEGHQLHVQLAEERVGGGGAAGHGHHVLLAQVHALGGAAAGALVVAVLQGLVLPPTQGQFSSWSHRVCLVLCAETRLVGFQLRLCVWLCCNRPTGGQRGWG